MATRKVYPARIVPGENKINMRRVKVTSLAIKKSPKYLVPCLMSLALLAGLLAAVFGPSGPVVRAITPPASCFAFNTSTNTITNYYNNEGNNAANPACPRAVDIPSTIGGKAVTKIGNNAFRQKGLSAITIPVSVTSVGTWAFAFNQITSLAIPASMTSIGDYAFFTNKLADLTIPGNVTSIGDGVFASNDLSSLVIQEGVTSIGSGAFAWNRLVVSWAIPASAAQISPDALFGQNPWADGVRDSTNADKYILSTDPAIVQHVYDNIWYSRIYTADPANPSQLTDSALPEGMILATDRNKNGTLADSIGGHIINPASTIVKYLDSKGAPLSPDVTVTGLKTGKSPSSALDSADYLHSYLVTESAIPAPLNPFAPTPEETAAMQLGFSQYYRLGQSVAFAPKTIAGYVAPAAQTVTLSQEDNTVTFVYKQSVTSVPFASTIVTGGELTASTPPANTLTPLIARSSLAIADGAGSVPSDCSTIESASLLAPGAITARTLPSGTSVLGGLDFSLACTSGGRTGVEFALGTTVPDPTKLLVFKYNASTRQLTDITNKVTFSSQTIDGQLRTVINYDLLDGGELDEDGVANGIITDPIMIGYKGDLTELAGGRLAETGTSLRLALAVPIVTILVGSSLLLAPRANRTM